MERAAVDGRGGAVHPHGALHAPLRTTDSELRRPSQEKNHRRAVHPEDGGRRRRHEEREEPGGTLVPKIYRRVSFAGSALFAEPRRAHGLRSPDGREMCSRTVTGNG